MSAKWERSKRWDDEHIPAALWPIKRLLRIFSSVWTAVCLLVLVACYGILASVPIGMLVEIPTYLIYGVTLVVAIAIAAVVPLLIGRRLLRRAPRGLRFGVLFVVTLAAGLGGAVLWFRELWPVLHYDPATGRGLMLFAGFVNDYRSTTLRRLPVMEMSELEFYSWWPLRVILILFVTNLMVATVRRIEFIFVNLGVLTVHTGIVTIALGSVYYSGLKLEGDTILLAGTPDKSGVPGPGPYQDVFFDNTTVSLFVAQDQGWEMRPLRHVPRYNDYALGAMAGRTSLEASGRIPPWLAEGEQRVLGVSVPPSTQGRVDPALSFRIVGFASYAEPAEDWLQADPPRAWSSTGIGAAGATGAAGPKLNPMRIVYLHSDLPDKDGHTSSDPVFAFSLLPAEARTRVAENSVMSVEYTMGMPESRWSDLSVDLPAETRHALIVEVPGKGADGGVFRAVYPVGPDKQIDVGATGYKVTVKELTPKPPFPIITEGYRDGQSSVAVVHITQPDGKSYDRWVYHRFPEIAQDMLEELNERGMPKRRDPDASISVRYIDASLVHVYLDERSDGSVRALVRTPGGGHRAENLGPDGLLKDMVPKVSLRIGERWAHAEAVERPVPVEESKRDKSMVGTRDKAMVAVEVSVNDGATQTGQAWKRIVWLPFTKYMGLGMGTERTVALPDGRNLRLAFGREWHPLSGFRVSLVNFEMIAYDHRGSPRDYQSILRVEPTAESEFQAYEHVTKLNAPLRAPFMWSGARSWFENTALKLGSGLNPHQFKLSQAGWDAEGWRQTQALADQKLIPRPYASFTILGVGNNPGIHIIALGAVLMALGIPWAFYVKPWILRRRKAKIQAQLAAGTYRPPVRHHHHPVANGVLNGAVAPRTDQEQEAPARGGRG